MFKIFNWAMLSVRLRNIIAVKLILFSIVVLILAIYGSVCIYTGQEKFETIKIQQIEIAELKEKIHWLRQINDLSIVLEQVLTPLQIDELKMLNERIRQDKYRIFKKTIKKEEKCLD